MCIRVSMSFSKFLDHTAISTSKPSKYKYCRTFNKSAGTMERETSKLLDTYDLFSSVVIVMLNQINLDSPRNVGKVCPLKDQS